MNHIKGFILVWSVILGLYLSVDINDVQANTQDFYEKKVQIVHDDVVLDGTILIPYKTDSHAGIVIVHGAGMHGQNDYRQQGEAFARSGIAALIYDKRTKGYSASGFGEKSRSFSLLADDALAAVKVLRSQEYIDPARVGLWGESEGGGWVTPLAASRSQQVSFLITVGASGISPIQQTSWHMENTLRYQGITSQSLIDAATRKGLRFLVSAEMFAEATYQPMPVLERVDQPVLAIWGSNERNSPPVESAKIFQQALQRGGNSHYTMHYISNADHSLRSSPDGFKQLSDSLAPGSMEVMTTWIDNLVEGKKLGPSTIGQTPEQARISAVEVNKPTRFDSVWLHLAIIIALVALFLGYVGWTWILQFRHYTRPVKKYIRWLAYIHALTGLVTIVGFYVFLIYTIITYEASFVIFGRPFIWLLLQLFAWKVLVLTLFLAVFWWLNRSVILGAERVRLTMLLVGGILFIPWAYHWQLFFI